MSTPTTAAPPAATTNPPKADLNPFIVRLFDDFGKVADGSGTLVNKVAPAPEPTTAPAAATPPPADPAAAPAPPAPPAPAAGDPAKPADPAVPPATPPAAAPKKIEVEVAKPLDELVRDVIAKMPPAPPAPPVEKPPLPDPDAAFISTLSEAERDELEFAQYAAKANPEKYGDMPKKITGYLRKVGEYVDAKRKTDPSWDVDEDEGFKALIDEKPEYSGVDRKKLEHRMIAEQASARTEERLRPEIERANRRAEAVERAPQLAKVIDGFTATIVDTLASDSTSPIGIVAAKVKELGSNDEGWNAARAINPLAADIALYQVNRAKELGREYLELATESRAPAKYDPNLPANHRSNLDAIRQSQLFQFVAEQEGALVNCPDPNVRVVNGRQFATRETYSKMPEAERRRHWTLEPADVLNILSVGAMQAAAVKYNAEIAQRESQGYAVSGKPVTTTQATPQTPPTKKAAETAQPPPAPGSAAPGVTVSSQDPGGNGLLSPEIRAAIFRNGDSRWV